MAHSLAYDIPSGEQAGTCGGRSPRSMAQNTSCSFNLPHGRLPLRTFKGNGQKQYILNKRDSTNLAYQHAISVDITFKREQVVEDKLGALPEPVADPSFWVRYVRRSSNEEVAEQEMARGDDETLGPDGTMDDSPAMKVCNCLRSFR